MCRSRLMIDGDSRFRLHAKYQPLGKRREYPKWRLDSNRWESPLEFKSDSGARHRYHQWWWCYSLYRWFAATSAFCKSRNAAFGSCIGVSDARYCLCVCFSSSQFSFVEYNFSCRKSKLRVRNANAFSNVYLWTPWTLLHPRIHPVPFTLSRCLFVVVVTAPRYLFSVGFVTTICVGSATSQGQAFNSHLGDHAAVIALTYSPTIVYFCFDLYFIQLSSSSRTKYRLLTEYWSIVITTVCIWMAEIQSMTSVLAHFSMVMVLKCSAHNAIRCSQAQPWDGKWKEKSKFVECFRQNGS